jgi:hypothetical protein
MDLYEQMKKVLAVLEAAHIPHALCGGLAMAVHRFPRATMDIDLMIEESSLAEATKIAKSLGYTMDVGLMTFARGAVKIYRLTMIDAEFGDVLPLDFLLVTPALRQVWETRMAVEWEGGTLRVVSREGLVQLKRLRHSGQDQDDISRLEDEG